MNATIGATVIATIVINKSQYMQHATKINLHRDIMNFCQCTVTPSNHYGSMGGGHYTCSARNLVSGQWMTFDDSRVSRLDPKNIDTSAAYVLFYLRRDKRPESWGPVE